MHDRPNSRAPWCRRLTGLSALVAAVAVSVARADSLDSFIADEMRAQHIPGMSVAVVKDGSLRKARGYGLANVELQAPASAETVYQLASMTKQFTAAAVMLLVQDGKLGLDDNVAKLLDDAPASWSGITVRHLLTMTSGIADYSQRFGDSREDFTEERLYDSIQKLPLDFAPGEKWQYSNSNYVLLAMIIRKLTTTSYDAFLGERVFKPLGMADTRRDDESAVVDRRAALYEWRNDRLVNCRHLNASLLNNGDGGLLTTALDLARWDAALEPGRLLSRESLRDVWTPVSSRGTVLKHYGFGWFLNESKGHRVVGHGGGRPGTSTQISRFLDDRVTVIVLANRSEVNAERLAHQVARFYIPDLPEYDVHSIAHPPRWDDSGKLIPVAR